MFMYGEERSMNTLFDIQPLSKAQVKRNKHAVQKHARTAYRQLKAPTLIECGAFASNGKTSLSLSKKKEKVLRMWELRYLAYQIVCDAMNRSDAILEPCPHCPGTLVKRVVIKRAPFEPLVLSLDHTCPRLWGDWGRGGNRLSDETIKEIVYGPSLWKEGRP
jgi:hypothetical protein